MPSMELYLDEDVPIQLADLLKARGLIVHLPKETGTVSRADSIHLQVCSRRHWVIVTQNRRDFRRLHWLWMTLNHWKVLRRAHGGILTVFEQEPALPEKWAPAIEDLLQRQMTLQGLMYMWRPSKQQWESQLVSFM